MLEHINASLHRTTRLRSLACCLSFLSLIGTMLSTGSTAYAGPMHNHSHWNVESQAGLGRSPWYQHYGMHPTVPSSLRYDVMHGFLPDTPFVSYLRWRQSLDPARFDYYHPRVANLLAEQNLVPATVNSPPIPSPLGQTIGGSISSSPPLGPPQPQIIVSEPGMLSIAMVLIGSAAAARSRRRTRAQD